MNAICERVSGTFSAARAAGPDPDPRRTPPNRGAPRVPEPPVRFDGRRRRGGSSRGPEVEVLLVGHGARVVGAQDAIGDALQSGVLIAGGGRIARIPGPRSWRRRQYASPPKAALSELRRTSIRKREHACAEWSRPFGWS